jgi:peptidoglycan hydrolase-like amidase
MRTHSIRSNLAALAALLVLSSGCAAFAEATAAPGVQSFAPAELTASGTIRVYLESLKNPAALGVTIQGSYALESDPGFQFASGSKPTFAAHEGSVYMSVGGLLIDMGESLTLTRHKARDAKKSGLYIHGTARDNLYAGDLQLTAKGDALRAILHIDIEEYLLGVVPYEMSDSFPIEALKAQAVAARTYALSRSAVSKSRDYDLVDTANDQVFQGFDANCENAILAVSQTRGLAGVYKDNFATCYFTASNGGQTALPNHIWGGTGDYGYLDIRDDPCDLENTASPVKRLTTPADGEKIDPALKALLVPGLTEAVAARGMSDELQDVAIERIASISPEEPAFDDGSRMYKSLRFSLIVRARRLQTTQRETTNEAGESVTQPEEILGDPETLEEPFTVDLSVYTDVKKTLNLGLSGPDCELVSVVRRDVPDAAEGAEAPVADSFDIELRRYGHGVGMSQRGAQQMAAKSASGFMDILAFYYPNMQVTDMRYAENALTQLAGAPSIFGSARPRPTVRPTPKPLPALKDGERYAKVTLSSKSSTLNVRGLPTTDGKILDILANGQRVIVVQEINGEWLHIKTAEVEGYASKEFLTFE